MSFSSDGMSYKQLDAGMDLDVSEVENNDGIGVGV